jgi:hypothetical protein
MLKRFSSSPLPADELTIVTPTCDPLPVAALPKASLSEDERSVIRLAQQDPISSIGPVTRRQRLLQVAFGKRPVTRLSDPRLEALRCFVIARRHGAQSRAALIAAGYSASQVTLVEILAGRVRQSRGAPAWASALAAILAMAVGSWGAFGYFRDLLVSLMVSGTGAVTFLPLLLRIGRP